MLSIKRLCFAGSAVLLAAGITHCGGGMPTMAVDMAMTMMPLPDLAAPDLTPPAPVINQVMPTSASNAGGTQITILGTGFRMGATVSIGGNATCTSPNVTATSITCTLPAKAGSCGPTAVIVTNPDMQQATSPMGMGGFSLRPAMVSFAMPVTSTTPANPRRIYAADFNGDGRPDLFTANQGGNNNASFFLNQGMGTFAAALNLSTTGATNIADVVGIDVNGDGKRDLVTANGTTGNVTVYLGGGDGTFMAGTNFASIAGGNSIAAADLNGDNRPDLAIGATSAATIGILLNNGTGGFVAAVSANPPGSVGDLALIDVNGDAKPDLVNSNFNGTNISVRLGMGGTMFGAVNSYAAGTNPFGMAVFDVNNDGKRDIVVANRNGANISILIGDGQGAFGMPTNLTSPTGPEGVDVADVNGDGILDILSANVASSNWSYYQGMGNGMFAAAVTTMNTSGSAGIVALDLNGDSFVDVATSNNGGNTIGVNLAQCN